MSICQHCQEALRQSQYRGNRTYKSCPRCSVANGKEHIFYEYPSKFGTTELRATANTPDGAQSYCVLCRSGSNVGPYSDALRCSQL